MLLESKPFETAKMRPSRESAVQIRRNSHYRKRGAAAPKSEDLSDGILLEISSLGNRGNGQILCVIFLRAFFRPALQGVFWF